MGWTTGYDYGMDLSNSSLRKKFLNQELSGNYGEVCYNVLDASMVGNTYYAAIKKTNNTTKKAIVFGCIVLTSYSDNMLSYKDMDETEMPFAFDCPKKILRQLTPTDNEYAKQWRSLCEQWQYRKSLLRKCRQTDDTITIRRENDCNDIELFYDGLYKKWLEVKRPQYYVKVNEILPNLIRVGSHEIKRFRDLVD